MPSAEASRSRTVKGEDDQGEEVTTTEGLSEKYPRWSLSAIAKTTDPRDKAEESARVFKGKNTFV
jgi:hypothetical protein